MTLRLALAALLLCGVTAPVIATEVRAAEPTPRTTTQPAAACPEGADWNMPAAPLHIYADTWYVGTCGLSSILITSPQGHVLIDGATEKAAPLIEANIRALGFKVEDVRIILNSHEHLDHAGGIAQLQRDSGATVMALSAAAGALEHGKGDRGDPQYLSIEAFPAIPHVKRLKDGEEVTLGPIRLTAHATPGHTPGATTWTWDSCQDGRCHHIVYADSLSAYTDDVYRYSDEAAHPGVLASFRQAIATMAALPCDILLTPHPDASQMWKRLGPNATLPLVDETACRRYGEAVTARLDKRLADEAAKTEKEKAAH
ncbi:MULTISPECIES: subclass B3 metallo-beta-lactamase [Nitrospirillum]|uniref:Metallo-beta-lactamase class B n=1 Tax=Nitrospirillum amazonense TaxID=28077 RepID=A0A560FIY7_9PROT|nr:subclass B3 metallo-beta-lactamase [Nitrospirillum amazonense]MEC4594181.1 subclass B3 metallo-beta-lactamase [Nitrospirillum amazonense]TWB21580.1 metallo-beta-lactamase class B [Nitrospirillum amazonense]